MLMQLIAGYVTFSTSTLRQRKQRTLSENQSAQVATEENSGKVGWN
jgi:hypothetical protein